jgi:hypothetical protein
VERTAFGRPVRTTTHHGPYSTTVSEKAKLGLPWQTTSNVARRAPSHIQVIAAIVLVVPAVAIGISAWHSCGSRGELCRLDSSFFPEYDSKTRQVILVVHDLSGNGIVDTWVYRTEAVIDRIEFDQDEDGVSDRVFVQHEDGSWHAAPVGHDEKDAASLTGAVLNP